MRAVQEASKVAALAGLTLALALGINSWGQAAPASSAPAADSQTASPAAQPAPGTTPVGGDVAAPANSKDDKTPATSTQSGKPDAKKSKDGKPAPGTAPVGGDSPAPASTVNPDKIVEPGSQKVTVKPGSRDDVSAVGNRDIGGRGLGNWYSTDTEIKMGKGYAMEVEKSTKLITDPVVTEYVNRIGQNIVKNSDCKVPFTIKVIDSDEVNAFALPGGFFFVNSGLILNADEEAELAGVMAHETAHV